MYSKYITTWLLITSYHTQNIMQTSKGLQVDFAILKYENTFTSYIDTEAIVKHTSFSVVHNK